VVAIADIPDEKTAQASTLNADQLVAIPVPSKGKKR
jgi:hypothetical protein